MFGLTGRARARDCDGVDCAMLEAASTLATADTVRVPPGPGGDEDAKVVRPCLAILFRVAVGPAADYYAPRFLEYERVGRSFPSWNWVAPWVPTLWAFHHRLWGAGAAFALWPLAAMAAFGLIDPYLGDSIVASLAGAAALLWLAPGVVAALTANSLLFHDARRRVRRAEAATAGPLHAARLLGEHAPVAPATAVALGAVAVAAALFAAAPSLRTAFADRVVRTHVAEALAALEPLQRRVEERFGLATAPTLAPVADRGPQRGAEFLEAVSVDPESGRVRAVLGASIPELAERWILLAPTLDRDARVRWTCIPIGIPARYLPQACRQGRGR